MKGHTQSEKWESAVKELFGYEKGDVELELNTKNKTFSVKNPHIKITGTLETGLGDFFRHYRDVFENFSHSNSDEYIYPQNLGGVAKSEIGYKHKAYDRRVVYNPDGDFFTDYALEAYLTSDDTIKRKPGYRYIDLRSSWGADLPGGVAQIAKFTDEYYHGIYKLDKMVLRYVPVPHRKNIEIPKFPEPIELIQNERHHLRGNKSDYRSTFHEEIFIYSPERGHELGQFHIIEQGIDDVPRAKLYLNTSGILSLRQDIIRQEPVSLMKDNNLSKTTHQRWVACIG